MGRSAFRVEPQAPAASRTACPNCRSPLAELIQHGRKACVCPRGHGRAVSASAARAWVVDEFQADFGEALTRGKENGRACPRCKKQFLLTRFYRLPLEHCRGCDLVWLTDGLMERMPFRPEKERERASSSVRLPVEVKFDPNLEAVKELYSPFEGVRRGPHPPVATLGLILACLLVTYAWWALGRPEAFVSYPREPLRFLGAPLILSLFTHGSWGHFLGNSYFLFVAGTVLESNVGWRRLLALFFLTGLAAELAHALHGPHGGIGASGAISGVVVALVATQPNATYALRPSLFGVPLLGSLFTVSLKVPVWLWAFVWFGFDVYAMGRADGVGHAAHLGGAVLGALLASLMFFGEQPKPTINNA